MKVIIEKLDNVFKMNNEFLEEFNEDKMKLRIPEVRSNTIGSQIACIARARDAYSKCILEDRKFSWEPDFPYEDRYDSEKVLKHLNKVGENFIKYLSNVNDLSDNQMDLILDLIGHEYLHQGQLVRYIYANNLEMPTGIKSFWHLED